MSIPAFIIGLIGAAQMGAAYLYFQVAKSAIHETVSAILFGSGSIVLAIAVLMYELQNHADKPRR